MNCVWRPLTGAATPSPEAFEATRSEVVSTLSLKDLPRKRIVIELIESASSKEHIDEMFELLKKLKIEVRRATCSVSKS